MKCRGASTLEYAILIIIILSVMMVMKESISRSMNGRWKSTGESFGFGRQYDVKKTTECAYAQISASYGVWYDAQCYQQAVMGSGSANPGCAAGDVACETRKMIACGEASKSYCCEGRSTTDNSHNSNCKSSEEEQQ
jgi:hypothetical protein